MVTVDEQTGIRTLSVTIGVDVGQRVDPSAICVTEAQRADGARASDTVHLVRMIERLPLGTGYKAVAERVAAVTAGVYARLPKPYPNIVIDATGVGRPIVEMCRAALLDQRQIVPIRWAIVAATFTHGDRLSTRVPNPEGWLEMSVGKAYLVSRLKALLQTERLKLPRTPEAEQLAKELLDYEIHVDEDANDKYGAFKVGSHDDMVTALGLAALSDQTIQRRF